MRYSHPIGLFPIALLLCSHLVTFVTGQGSPLTGNDTPATYIPSIPLWEEFLRILAAFGMGALIGLERENTNFKRHLRGMAGMRTHGLISAGSCLIMLISIYGFVEVVGPNNARDPSRLAAQAVSGIGFIGAGSILKGGSTILGLTSAASLFVAMAIGLGFGCGYWLPTLIASATCLICMVVLKQFAKLIFGHRDGPGFQCDLTIVAVDKSHVTKDLVSSINAVLSISKLEIQRRPQFEIPKQLEASAATEPISPNRLANKEKEVPHFHPDKELSGIRITESTACANEKSVSSLSTPPRRAQPAAARPQFPLPVSMVNTIEYSLQCYLNHCKRSLFGKRVLELAMKYADNSDILVFKIGDVRDIDEGDCGQFLHAEEPEKGEKEADTQSKDTHNLTDR